MPDISTQLLLPMPVIFSCMVQMNQDSYVSVRNLVKSSPFSQNSAKLITLKKKKSVLLMLHSGLVQAMYQQKIMKQRKNVCLVLETQRKVKQAMEVFLHNTCLLRLLISFQQKLNKSRLELTIIAPLQQTIDFMAGARDLVANWATNIRRTKIPTIINSRRRLTLRRQNKDNILRELFAEVYIHLPKSTILIES